MAPPNARTEQADLATSDEDQHTNQGCHRKRARTGESESTGDISKESSRIHLSAACLQKVVSVAVRSPFVTAQSLQDKFTGILDRARTTRKATLISYDNLVRRTLAARTQYKESSNATQLNEEMHRLVDEMIENLAAPVKQNQADLAQQDDQHALLKLRALLNAQEFPLAYLKASSRLQEEKLERQALRAANQVKDEDTNVQALKQSQPFKAAEQVGRRAGRFLQRLDLGEVILAAERMRDEEFTDQIDAIHDTPPSPEIKMPDTARLDAILPDIDDVMTTDEGIEYAIQSWSPRSDTVE